MIRITSQTKIPMASPDQIWSLIPGSNHFEGDMPDAVAKALTELQSEGVITIDVIDTAGGMTKWSSTSRVTQ